MNSLGHTILAVAAMGLGIGSAHAVPATYNFSGDAGGFSCVVCNGSDNSSFSGAFTLVVTGDTTAVNIGGAPFFTLSNVHGIFTQGSFSATFTGVTVESNAAAGFHNIDFYNSSFLNGLGLSDPALIGYNLLTSIGPITVNGSGPPGSLLTPTFGGGGFATTGSETVVLTSDDSLTFSATVGSVPEPATLSLTGIGLAALAAIRRRKASS
jgi:hypothetical protein